MAETHFFMTGADSLAFVSYLIEAFSAEFVPEKSQSPPPFPRYTTLAEVKATIETEPYYSRFFVLSSRWERLPLVFHEVHTNHGCHFFVVSQRAGGPAFDFMVGRTYIEKDARWMVSGSFSDYSWYVEDESFLRDHSRYRTFNRPESMTTTHNEVRKYMRRNGCRTVCCETGHLGPWVVTGALQEYNSGIWLRAGNYHFKPRVARERRTTR